MNKYTAEAASISIAICTRERPQMLTTLLSSFKRVQCPTGIQVSIDIIENHTEKKLAALIEKISKTVPIQTNHHWEPRLGIPIARNTALRIAKESKATHIIFLDDDEHVSETWLNELWHTYLKYETDCIIQGAVIASIQTTKNKHLHHNFDRQIKTTGERLELFATNNLLIELGALEQYDIKFDESHPLAGGTDNKLARKVTSYGIPIRYCAEAIAFEDIPEERVNISWLSRRNFRIGLTNGEYNKKLGTGLKFPATHAWTLLRYAIRTLTYIVRFNRHKLQKQWLKMCRTAGRVLGFFNLRIDSYKKTDGY